MEKVLVDSLVTKAAFIPNNNWFFMKIDPNTTILLNINTFFKDYMFNLNIMFVSINACTIKQLFTCCMNNALKCRDF